jgi:hypothetical protein
MRFVRRAHDTKTSVIRREAVSSAPDAASMTSAWPAPPPSSGSLTVNDARTSTPAAPPAADSSHDALEDSDVFLCEPPRQVPNAIREVTLFVHGWDSVEPGLLSWTFPSLRAALDAVRRMKNAIGWCVVSGTGWSDLDAARAGGAVLVEQLT